jgi:septum formation protein
MRIILASKSPRRKEILSRFGLKFEVIASDADESVNIKDPSALVRELSLRKGRAVLDMLKNAGADISDTLIISSDTVVCCGGEIFGKPADRAEAKKMLLSMSGRAHKVYTGIAAIYGGREAHDVSETEVSFARMSDGDIEWYLNAADYADKAGAYAVQGAAALFIEEIKGDYFTVVGLPVRKLSELLRDKFGINLPSLCFTALQRPAQCIK